MSTTTAQEIGPSPFGEPLESWAADLRRARTADELRWRYASHVSALLEPDVLMPLPACDGAIWLTRVYRAALDDLRAATRARIEHLT
jgi:hypothetical protein